MTINKKLYLILPLALVALLAGSYFAVHGYIDYKIKSIGDQKKIQDLTQALKKTQEQDIATTTSPQSQPVQAVPTAPVKATSTAKIKIDNSASVKTQLLAFENYFENELLDAYIYCDGLAVYNNMAKYPDPQIDINTAFPEGQEFEILKCRSTYLKASQEGSKLLVAQPQLVNLRIQITEFLNNVVELAQYALDGGYNGPTISIYQSKYKPLRTSIREEILKQKQIYNLQ